MSIFTPPPLGRILLTNEITPLIDDALVSRKKAEYAAGRGSGAGDVAKHRIGAGYIGLDCDRALAYKYHKAKFKEREESFVSPGELQRHAEAGFWTEDHVSKWMLWAGFNLFTVDPSSVSESNPEGRQFGYKAAPGPDGKFRIAGELDGVITGVPAQISQDIAGGKVPQLPWLWESKKATDKKFKKFSKEGVKEADPKYYGQLQCNMTYMKVGHTLFTMLNLDSMEFYFELVPFDPPYAQKLQDRAAKVLQSESPEELPRIAKSQADFRCKFCDYAGICWESKRANPSAPSVLPFWGQGQSDPNIPF